MINISISKHARQRFWMRIEKDDVIMLFAKDAFEKGERLLEDEFYKMFKEHINKKGFFSIEYRKKDNLIYVFGGRGEGQHYTSYRLITVLPNNPK